MDTLPAWITALVAVAGLVGIVWWNGRFNGAVVTRLDTIDHTLNGPLQAKFDSAAKHNKEAVALAVAAADKADAAFIAFLNQLPICERHAVTLDAFKSDIEQIKKLEAQRQERREAAEDSG